MSGVRLARRLRPWAWGLSCALLIALVVLQIVVWDRSELSGDADAQAVSGSSETGLTLFAVGKRPPAPKLAGRTVDGEAFDLSDSAGQVVVINVWGSWCAPCRKETPDLVRVANETADQGVLFVGIDTRDNRPSAQAFIRNFGVPYPSVFDEGGQTLLPFVDLITISAVPSTLVVDRDGNVAARVVGPVTYTTLSGLVDDLLQEVQ